MTRPRILVLEDDATVAAQLVGCLEHEGHKVAHCRNGEQGLQRLRHDHPDLAIVAVELPGIDGIELCRRAKAEPATSGIPIVILTDRGEAADLVVGLGIGADDYLTKPFTARELVARVKIALRRGPLRQPAGSDERMVRGALVVDASRHEALLGDRRLHLTPTEMRLLHVLAAHPGRVFRRPHLVARAIGEDAAVTARNIDVHMRSLRRKFGEHAAMLETVRGVGYRLAEPVVAAPWAPDVGTP